MNNREARRITIEWMRGKASRSAAAWRYEMLGDQWRSEALEAAKNGTLYLFKKPIIEAKKSR